MQHFERFCVQLLQEFRTQNHTSFFKALAISRNVETNHLWKNGICVLCSQAKNRAVPGLSFRHEVANVALPYQP